MSLLRTKVEAAVGSLEVVRRPRGLAETDSLEAAVRLLSRHRLREVPVVDRDGRIVGMLSRADLTRQMARMVVAKNRGA
jgi:CBS domain-containing protein